MTDNAVISALSWRRSASAGAFVPGCRSPFPFPSTKETEAMNEIIDLTKELIRFKTMHTEPDEIQRCMDFIQEYVTRLGLEAKRINHDYVP